MRQQCVFLSLFSYCFISENDSGKREKLKITEPEEICDGVGVERVEDDGVQSTGGKTGRLSDGNGVGAHAGCGVLCEVRDQGGLGFEKGGFKIVFVENKVT